MTQCELLSTFFPSSFFRIIVDTQIQTRTQHLKPIFTNDITYYTETDG